MLYRVSFERGDVLPVRAAVVLAVPALGAAAHGSAGGESVSASNLVLLTGVGAVSAIAAAPSQQSAAAVLRRPVPTWLRLAAVLSAAQAAAHALLAAGTHPMPGHSGGVSWPMSAAHAVAVALTAVVIVIAAQLAQLVGAVLVAARRLVTGRYAQRRSAPRIAGVVRVVTVVALTGAGGVRGPPGMVAVSS